MNASLEATDKLIQQMNAILAAKYKLIAKLSNKVDKKAALLQKNQRERKICHSLKKEHSSRLFNLRRLTTMNDTMSTYVHKFDYRRR